MRVSSFFKLVEIRTKLASVIPLLLGTVYALYRFQTFEPAHFLLMFGSLICIDMFTTGLNNYLDYKRAVKKHGYNYESHNAIVRDKLKETAVLAVIAALYAAATFLGILLFLNTNFIVLGLGVLSFLVGIFYSFGPVPISRTPFGEVFSGFFMGFVILFLSVYIHIYEMNVVSLGFEGLRLFLQVDLVEAAGIFLFSLAPVSGIANIMLANNTCDIDDDIENKRYTLPVYIGKEKALWLYASLYYLAYADIAVLALLGLVPPVCLATLLTWIPVRKNIKKFYTKQTKKDTFALSVQNFFLMTVPLLLLFWGVWAAGRFI